MYKLFFYILYISSINFRKISLLSTSSLLVFYCNKRTDYTLRIICSLMTYQYKITVFPTSLYQSIRSFLQKQIHISEFYPLQSPLQPDQPHIVFLLSVLMPQILYLKESFFIKRTPSFVRFVLPKSISSQTGVLFLFSYKNFTLTEKVVQK